MKYFAIYICFLLFSLVGLSQQTISGSITHDGLQREYILYIPPNYTGSIPVPLLLNFHGYGSNATEQMNYGDFRPVSDTAGFLIVHPQGTLFNGTTHWNVGGWTIGSMVDDVGFTEALIDSLSLMYQIDSTRIFATGMSNGGFMSFLLACQLSNRIAAIASVTGSMTTETYNNANPLHPTPILQIHAPTDPVVPYNGASWTKSIEEVLQYWVDFNNCNTLPIITTLPDLNPNDGSTVEHTAYFGGDNGVAVEHYKVIGGGHTWPGSAFPLPGTNYDINASIEIWKFLSQYDINGSLLSTHVEEPGTLDQIIISPNPTNSSFRITSSYDDALVYTLYSQTGKRLIKGFLISGKNNVDIGAFAQGIYFLKIKDKIFKVIKRN
ncbi:MAG: T9SS type A sorting domain-containing protein [Bacteroidales bacterium]|nr:T9SS type A sorting domain-containing protein [Bacteroidales bacterium]MCF8403153.1 T9SS type A sorting domain-containing protein [Bacteroidales bacterium]